MISSLQITNLLAVDNLSVNFKRGFNALTGETGAGKSILIDCLGFVLGHSGRRGSIRKDINKEAEVIVVFDLEQNSEAFTLLQEAGFNIERELIIRRCITTENKKKGFINDRPCTVDFIKSIANTLIEFQSQNEEQILLNRNNHITLLDGFANSSGTRKKLRQVWDQLRIYQAKLSTLKEEQASILERRKFLEDSIAEITDFAPELGEENALIETRKINKNGIKTLQHLESAYHLISSENLESTLIESSKELMRLSSLIPDKFEEPIKLMDTIIDSLSKISSELSDSLTELSEGIAQAEEIDDRFYELRTLAKKYDTTCDGLVKLPESFALEVKNIVSKIENEDTLKSNIENLTKDYKSLSSELSIIRKKAGVKLDRSIMEQLRPLKLGHSVFRTVVSETEPSHSGVASVSFTASTNKGFTFGSVEKVASGGELSRFLLALKVCLVKGAKERTLLFDEIDRGVGGSTADAIGRRLLELSKFGQVITVTHSPQVAALASNHYQVAKKMSKSGDILIQINELTGKLRIDELARMISGKIITEEARAAASILLEDGEDIN